MDMRRSGFLRAVLFLACSGLAACAPTEVTVPTKETPSSHHFSGTRAQLSDVEDTDEEVCPFMDRTAGRTLVVFEPGAVGQARPAGVIVDGVTLLDGTAFRAGPRTDSRTATTAAGRTTRGLCSSSATSRS